MRFFVRTQPVDLEPLVACFSIVRGSFISCSSYALAVTNTITWDLRDCLPFRQVLETEYRSELNISQTPPRCGAPTKF